MSELSRTEDVDTAVEAGRAIRESVPRLQQAILQALFDYPQGKSTRELAHYLAIDFSSISPRMRPMAEKGWVEMTDKKSKNPTGKGWGRVWVITHSGTAALI
jgi:hypothetical protein